MTAIKQLSDAQLLEATKSLAQKEREVLTDVLHHLREVRRRRLFSELGYKSMMDYAVRELQYSEDQAYHRLAAMEILTDLPEMEEKIARGTLTLSNVSLAAKTIRAEAKASGRKIDRMRKAELLKAVENKSKREAETTVQNMTTAPKEMLRPEILRVVADRLEVRMTLPASLEDKIIKIKAWLSHSHPTLTTAELFEKLCDAYIERREKPGRASRGAPIHAEVTPQNSKDLRSEKTVPGRKFEAHKSETTAPKKKTINQSRYIPAHLRQEIFARAGNKCAICGSERFLEIDHLTPIAHGGSNTAENLRLLCRPCNQRSAIKQLGQRKMDTYLERAILR